MKSLLINWFCLPRSRRKKRQVARQVLGQDVYKTGNPLNVDFVYKAHLAGSCAHIRREAALTHKG